MIYFLLAAIPCLFQTSFIVALHVFNVLLMQCLTLSTFHPALYMFFQYLREPAHMPPSFLFSLTFCLSPLEFSFLFSISGLHGWIYSLIIAKLFSSSHYVLSFSMEVCFPLSNQLSHSSYVLDSQAKFSFYIQQRDGVVTLVTSPLSRAGHFWCS